MDKKKIKVLALLAFTSFSVTDLIFAPTKIKNIEGIVLKEGLEMKLATYNTMFGMNGRSIILNGLGHISYHGLESKKLTNLFSKYNEKNVELMGKINADAIVLNEVLGSLKKDEIIKELEKHNYTSFCFNPTIHHKKPLDLGLLIASKDKFQELSFEFPMEPRFGGGGGACAVYFKEKNLTLLGVHLGIRENLIEKQLKEISLFLKKEKEKGRKIILMGDFNMEEKELKENRYFNELGLKGANKENTCSNTNLIKILYSKVSDNIFYDSSFKKINSGVSEGYSDHKLVWANLK